MVAFRSISSINWAERANTTVTAPTGIVNGDRLYLIQCTGFVGEAADPTPPTGFTALAGSWPIELDEFGFNVEVRAYSKTAASESGSYTSTHTTNESAATIICVSDPGATNPTPTQATGTGTTATATGLTVAANSLIIIVTVDYLQNPIGLSPPTGTTPTFTERLDATDTILYVATGVYAAGGATGNKSMTVKNNAGVDPWAAILIAVEPTAGAVVGPPYQHRPPQLLYR